MPCSKGQSLAPQLPLLPQLWCPLDTFGHHWTPTCSKTPKRPFRRLLLVSFSSVFPSAWKNKTKTSSMGYCSNSQVYPSSSSQEKFHPQAGEVWAVLSQAHTWAEPASGGLAATPSDPPAHRTAPLAGIRAVKAITQPLTGSSHCTPVHENTCLYTVLNRPYNLVFIVPSFSTEEFWIHRVLTHPWRKRFYSMSYSVNFQLDCTVFQRSNKIQKPLSLSL